MPHETPQEPRESREPQEPQELANIRPRRRIADGLDIRYAEAGPADKPTILLTNPWPESLYAFSRVWDGLAADFHLIAVDLPGFGQSERRTELYAPSAMGRFLGRLIEEWNLAAVHLVSPDVGTSAALHLAADRPGRVLTATVGSGAAAVPLDVTGPLKDFVEAPDAAVFAQLDPRDVVGGAVDSLPGEPVAREIREDYIASYSGDRFAESVAYVRSYPHELPLLAERLASINTPVQIISGRADGFVPPSNAEFLHAKLPDSDLHLLDAGHFVWEEAHESYERLVAAWIRRHEKA